MTQIALVKNDHFMLVGADSRIIYFNDDGSETCGSSGKFFRISPDVFMAVAGFGYGNFLGFRFLEQAQMCGLWQYEKILERIYLFLQSQKPFLDDILEGNLHNHDLNHAHFLLFGRHHEQKDKQPVFKANLISVGSGDNGSLSLCTISELITIPRQICLEVALSKHLRASQPSPESLLNIVLSYFRNLSRTTPYVGPPYYFACFQKNNFQSLRFNS